MFGSNKKVGTAIDPDQKEMIENARLRIKQKRGLFTHFVLFLLGSVALIVASQFLIKQDATQEIPQLLGIEWWVWVIMIWFLILVYHAFNVFITKRILGPEWEKRQYEKLVQKQLDKVKQLQVKVDKNHPLPESRKADKILSAPKTITMIAAAGENNELGNDGGIVWHLPDDFKRFKALTSGHHIIMGRKTFESLDGPLPNRTHIVITRDKNYKSADAIIVHDMETALAAVGAEKKPFIIGGGEIYKLGMSYANKIELTRVHGTFKADAYFPAIDQSQWKLVSSESHGIDEKHKYAFDYETWERV
ncbi:dihydrofolate reductase [Nonlabens antarcticus]|uniref:dihydrofolate reductase n=1 Tax=Nonlabens antarcticus TaxID=392714 RepID=UPI001891098B|nr:dihydrofolate reductase [Nonlabens antarcticus]